MGQIKLNRVPVSRQYRIDFGVRVHLQKCWPLDIFLLKGNFILAFQTLC